MARTYGSYWPVAHELEVQHNRLVQIMQISGTPKRVEEFLHTFGAREEKAQPARHAGKQIKE